MPWRRPGTTAEPGAGGRTRSGRGLPHRSGEEGRGGRRRWLLLLVLLTAAACAKQEPPPGTEPDQSPPGIRSITPADGSVVPRPDGPLRVRFDEPIEPPRGLARRLEASPVYSYRVEFGFDDIRVRPEEGWRPGAVYRIRFPGGVTDLLGNEREEPFEVTFSTGPAITDTRVSARIVDRVERRPQEGARVLFLAVEGDSVPYGAVADTGGRVELPSLPPDAYRAYAFRDLNGNRTLDRRLEPWDSAAFRLPDAGATVELDLRLLEPDSTPPRLALAEAVDSVEVELTFDDHLDPAQDVDAGAVTVTAAGGDTVELAGVGTTRAAAGFAVEDTAAEDTAARADTAAPEAAVADTLGPEAAAEPPGDTLPADDTLPPGDTVPADTLPLPSRTLHLRTDRPLRDSVRYRVRASGIRNLQGLAGGGDTLFVYRRAPAAAEGDTAEAGAAADTAGARAPGTDTLPPADTAGRDGAPPDTAAPADTTVVPDSAAVPDTTARDRDP